MQLNKLETNAWAELVKSSNDPTAGYRNVTLCTVDANLNPQARTVVLRSADPVTRTMEIHTDSRSPKWQDLSANPNSALLGYCTQTRTQLRFQGQVELFPLGTDRADAAWEILPAHTRSAYAGGPPGDELAFKPAASGPQPEHAFVEGDKKLFGVIVFRAASLDWFQLQRMNNIRARFLYDRIGVLHTSQWIEP